MAEDERQRKLEAGKIVLDKFRKNKEAGMKPKRKKRKKSSLVDVTEKTEQTVVVDMASAIQDEGESFASGTSYSQDDTEPKSSISDDVSIEDSDNPSYGQSQSDLVIARQRILELQQSLDGKMGAWESLLEENEELKLHLSVIQQGMNSSIDDSLNNSIIDANPDYRNIVLEYNQKMQEYQQALSQRELIIQQLTERLVITMSSRDDVQAESTAQAESLANEISLLKSQLQQAIEVLGKQKSDKGISPEELLDAKNEVLLLNQELSRKDTIIKDLCTKLRTTNADMESIQNDFQDEISQCRNQICSLQNEILSQNACESLSELTKQGDGDCKTLEMEFNKSLSQTEVKLDHFETGDESLFSIEKSSHLTKKFMEDCFLEESISSQNEQFQLSKPQLSWLNERFDSQKSSFIVEELNGTALLINSLTNRMESIKSCISELSFVSENTNAEMKSVEFELETLKDLRDKGNQIKHSLDTVKTDLTAVIENNQQEVKHSERKTNENKNIQSRMELLKKEKETLSEELVNLRKLNGDITELKSFFNEAQRLLIDISLDSEKYNSLFKELETTQSQLKELKIENETLHGKVLNLQKPPTEFISDNKVNTEIQTDFNSDSKYIEMYEHAKLYLEELEDIEIDRNSPSFVLNSFELLKDKLVNAERDLKISNDSNKDLKINTTVLNEKYKNELMEKDKKMSMIKLELESVLMELKYASEQKDILSVEYEILSTKLLDLENQYKVNSYIETETQTVPLIDDIQNDNKSGRIYAITGENENETVLESRIADLVHDLDLLIEANQSLKKDKLAIEAELSEKVNDLAQIKQDLEAHIELLKHELNSVKEYREKTEQELLLMKEKHEQWKYLSLEDSSILPNLLLEEHMNCGAAMLTLGNSLKLEVQSKNVVSSQLVYYRKKSEQHEVLYRDILERLKATQVEMKYLWDENDKLNRQVLEAKYERDTIGFKMMDLKESNAELISEIESRDIIPRKITQLGNETEPQSDIKLSTIQNLQPIKESQIEMEHFMENLIISNEDETNLDFLNSFEKVRYLKESLPRQTDSVLEQVHYFSNHIDEQQLLYKDVIKKLSEMNLNRIWIIEETNKLQCAIETEEKRQFLLNKEYTSLRKKLGDLVSQLEIDTIHVKRVSDLGMDTISKNSDTNQTKQDSSSFERFSENVAERVNLYSDSIQVLATEHSNLVSLIEKWFCLYEKFTIIMQKNETRVKEIKKMKENLAEAVSNTENNICVKKISLLGFDENPNVQKLEKPIQNDPKISEVSKKSDEFANGDEATSYSLDSLSDENSLATKEDEKVSYIESEDDSSIKEELDVPSFQSKTSETDSSLDIQLMIDQIEPTAPPFEFEPPELDLDGTSNIALSTQKFPMPEKLTFEFESRNLQFNLLWKEVEFQQLKMDHLNQLNLMEVVHCEQLFDAHKQYLTNNDDIIKDVSAKLSKPDQKIQVKSLMELASESFKRKNEMIQEQSPNLIQNKFESSNKFQSTSNSTLILDSSISCCSQFEDLTRKLRREIANHLIKLGNKFGKFSTVALNELMLSDNTSVKSVPFESVTNIEDSREFLILRKQQILIEAKDMQDHLERHSLNLKHLLKAIEDDFNLIQLKRKDIENICLDITDTETGITKQALYRNDCEVSAIIEKEVKGKEIELIDLESNLNFDESVCNKRKFDILSEDQNKTTESEAFDHLINVCELESLKLQLEKLNEKNELITAENSDLQNQIADLIDDHSKEMSSMDKNKTVHLKEELNKAVVARISFEEQLIQEKVNLNELTIGHKLEIDSINAILKETNEELVIWERKAKEFESIENNLNSEIAELQNKESKLISERKELQKQVFDLIEDHKQEMETEKLRLIQCMKEKEIAEENLKRLEVLLEELKRVVAVHEPKASTLSIEKSELQKQISDLIDDHRQELEQLQLQLSNEKKSNEEIKDIYKQESEKMQIQISNELERYSEVENNAAVLKSKCEDLIEEKCVLQKQISELIDDNKEEIVELQSKLRDRDEALFNVNNLRTEIEQLTEEKTNLLERCKAIEILHEKASVDILNVHEQEKQAIILDSEMRFDVLKNVHEEQLSLLQADHTFELDTCRFQLTDESDRKLKVLKEALNEEIRDLQLEIHEQDIKLIELKEMQLALIREKSQTCKSILELLTVKLGDFYAQLASKTENPQLIQSSKQFASNIAIFVEKVQPDPAEIMETRILSFLREAIDNLEKDFKQISAETRQTIMEGNGNCSYIDASVCTEELEDLVILPEVERLKLEIEESMKSQSSENDMLNNEIRVLKEHVQTLEECNEALQREMKEQEMIVADKIDARKRRQAAQTNSRLMNVLSDLVKTFVDTEQNIQSQLCNLGLSAQQSDGSSLLEEDNGPTSGNFYGSKEDFCTFPSHGDGLAFEMCEDGLDLTPRAWDAFAVAIGHQQEVETEGEDVVLGASRRLRIAVEHVLALLNELSETQQYQKIVELLHKNEELMIDLKDEEESKRLLCLDFIKAEDFIKNLKEERQSLEEKLHDIEKRHSLILIELKTTRARADTLEVTHEAIVEDKLLLEEHQKLLTSDMNNSGLKIALEKNSLLSNEKRAQQQKHEAEKQRLLMRINNLELSLEEIVTSKDEILEEKQREIEDLKTQMEAMEKQMMSNRKFIEEQVHEREQEQEDFQRELNKLKDTVKEKDRNQDTEQQLSKELDVLEQQLKVQSNLYKEAITKKDNIEVRLRLVSDKVKDLEEVISELENQLDSKSKTIQDQNQSLIALKNALTEHEAVKDDLSVQIKELKCSSIQEDVNEHIQSLDEQLESRNQELRQMAHCQSMLQEFRSQIRVLDEKVESKLRQIECFFAHLCLSPVPSEDNSQSDSCSKDIEERLLLIQEERVLSPSSVQWEELKRLESKIDNLLLVTDDAMKRLKDFEARVRLIKHNADDLQTEKSILQQQLSDQLFQISSLKTRIDDKRYDIGKSKHAGSAHELNEIKEKLNNENRQQVILKQKLQESSSTIDFLQSQLENKGREICKLEEEIFENACLCEKQVKKIEEFQKEIEELKVNAVTSVLIDIETQTDEKVKKDFDAQTSNSSLTDELLHTSALIQSSLDVVDKTHNDQLEAKVNILMEELNNLNQYKLHLEKDFDTVQVMLKEKEEEINNLQQESESHLTLEKEVSNLRQALSEEQNACASKQAKIETLNTEMDELNQCIKIMKEKASKQEVSLKNLEAELSAMNSKYAIEFDSQKQSEHKQKELQDIEIELKKQCFDKVKSAEEQFKKKLASESSLLGRTYEQSLIKIRDQHEQSMKDLEKQLAASFAREVEYVRALSKGELEEEQLKREQDTIHRDERHRKEIDNLKQEYKMCMRKLSEQHQVELGSLKNKETGTLSKEMKHASEVHKLQIESLVNEYETKMLKISEDNRLQVQTLIKDIQETERTKLKHETTQLIKSHGLEIENLVCSYESQLRKLGDLHRREIETENSLKETELEQFKLKISQLQNELQRLHNTLLLSRESTPESDGGASSHSNASTESTKLPRNIQVLFDKVLKEGLEVLSLTERRQLHRHVTPEPVVLLENGQNAVELWMNAKDTLLTEVQALKDILISENENDGKVAESMADILRDFLKREKNRLLLELQAYAAWDGRSSLTNCKELEEKLYNIEDRQEAALKELYGLVHGTLTKEKNNGLHFENQVALLTEQVEKSAWQIQKQKELLEYRNKQEKILHNEFQSSLQREQLNAEQLNGKLKYTNQRCAEFELSLTQKKSELNKLEQILERVQKDAEIYKNAAEAEKKHAYSLLQALESERANFSQLHIALDSEREHRSKQHVRDQNTILKLQASVNRRTISEKSSGTVSPENDRLSDQGEMNIISSMMIRNSQNVLLNEKCSKCSFYETILTQERETWKRHEDTMNRLLQSATSEITELKHQLQSISEKNESSNQRQKLLQLHWKYRRCEKHRSSLVYQKRYLLRVLQGYQSTETAALSVLGQMGVCTPNPSLPGSLSGINGNANSPACKNPITFRGTAKTVIAMIRFRSLSERTKQAQQFFFLGLQNVPQTRLTSLKLPVHGGGGSYASSNSSTSSTQSAPWSRIMHTFMRDSSSIDNTVSESKAPGNASSVANRGHSKLQECVLRLASLQKTLGLDGSA